MNRRSNYYVEVFLVNDIPHLRFARGMLNSKSLSDATTSVFMVRDCANQEEAMAKILAAVSKSKVPWNALNNDITRVM